jgi:D-xylose transport system permease protein
MKDTKNKSFLNVFNKIAENQKVFTMVFALAFIWLFFGFLTDWIFFSPRNLSNLFRQMTLVTFLSIGMVLVIVTGNIDLSVGSITGFVSAITAYVQANILPVFFAQVFPNLVDPSLGIIITILAVLSGLIVGLLIGFWHGWIIAYLEVPAFIATLGGMLIFRGSILGITQGKTIIPIEDSYRMIAQGYLPKMFGVILGAIIIILVFFTAIHSRNRKKTHGFQIQSLAVDMSKSVILSLVIVIFVLVMNLYRGIPTPVMIMVVVAFIFSYITKNTKFGRYAYAIGGNRDAAQLSGISIKGNIFKVFSLMGLLSGVSGVMLTGYVAAGTIAGGTNYELDAIGACVIGGTSLVGGEGTIIGALVGSLIMASLLNGMSVMNMPVFWQYIVRGFVLIAAVYVDVMGKKRR